MNLSLYKLEKLAIYLVPTLLLVGAIVLSKVELWLGILVLGLFIFISGYYLRSIFYVLLQIGTLVVYGFLLSRHLSTENNKLPHFTNNETIRLTGTITSPYTYSNHKYQFLIQSGPYQFNVYIEQLINKEVLALGTEISIKGAYKAPQGYRNFAGFQAEEYMFSQHIQGSVFAKGSDVQVVANPKLSFRNKVVNLRESSLSKLEAGSKYKKAVAYTEALLLGERSGLSGSIQELYQKYGLVHLLAISGMQVHLVTYALYRLLLRLGFVKEHILGGLLVLQPVLFVLTGESASVLRACLMTFFILIFQLLRAPVSANFSFCLAFLVAVFWNPDVIVEVGFLLSFLMTGFLMYSQYVISGAQGFLKKMMVTTLLAQIATIPILQLYFYEISSFGLVLNIFFIPFMNLLIFPLAMVMFVWTVLGIPFADVGFFFMDELLTISEKLLGTFDIVRFPTIPLLPMSNWLFLIFVLGLVWVMIQTDLLDWKKVRKWGSLLVVGMVVCFYYSVGSPEGRISFLDVGQGDCGVIVTPKHHEVLMVDTGGIVSFDGGNKSVGLVKNVLIPSLKRKGIRQVDYLLITHGDSDHSGAAADFMKRFRVKALILGGKESYSEAEKQLILLSKQLDVRVLYVDAGDILKLTGATVTFYSPERSAQPGNDASLVFTVDMNGVRSLWMGDAGVATEARLPMIQGVSVLKVGHHGSNTSSSKAFIERIQPVYGVISVGRNNRYGHPKQEALNTLQSSGVRVLRTDERGEIDMDLLGERLTFFTAVHKIK